MSNYYPPGFTSLKIKAALCMFKKRLKDVGKFEIRKLY